MTDSFTITPTNSARLFSEPKRPRVYLKRKIEGEIRNWLKQLSPEQLQGETLASLARQCSDHWMCEVNENHIGRICREENIRTGRSLKITTSPDESAAIALRLAEITAAVDNLADMLDRQIQTLSDVLNILKNADIGR